MTVDRNRFAQSDFNVDSRIAPLNGHAPVVTPSSASQPAKPRAGWWPFPGLLFVMLATNVAIVSITATFALSDSSFAVEPDYYQQAVKWEQTMAQRGRNGELGWTATMPPSIAGRPVVLQLRDREGAPVSGARVQMIAFHNAHSGNRLTTTLAEIEPGMYRSGESLTRNGIWEVRITAMLADDTFTAVIPHIVQAREGAP